MKKCLFYGLILIIQFFVSKPFDLDNENHSDESYTNYDEKMIEEDIAQKYISEMGLDKPGRITLTQFKELLMKIFTKGEKVEAQEEMFYKELIDKISISTPEEFDSSELSKYIDQDKFITYLDDLIKSKYGENVLNDFKNTSKLNNDSKDEL